MVVSTTQRKRKGKFTLSVMSTPCRSLKVSLFFLLERFLIFLEEIKWFKEKPSGDEIPHPRAQHLAITCPNEDRVFIFGGHATQTVRLNDAWFYMTKQQQWKRADGAEPESPNN